jgi:hypothetical protein
MATARFILALVLVALGCALLIVSFEPRPVTALWVGGVSHGSHFSAREPLNATQRNGERS